MTDETADPPYPHDPETCEGCRIVRAWHRARLCPFHAGERRRQLEGTSAGNDSERKPPEKPEGA